jgi:hypothetical protein
MVVDDEQVGIRLKVEVSFGGNKATPAWYKHWSVILSSINGAQAYQRPQR